MRSPKDIPQEEFRAHFQLARESVAAPYRKWIQCRQGQISRDPDCRFYEDEEGMAAYKLRPECEQELEYLRRQISLFTNARYPELAFPLEDGARQRAVAALRQDPDYVNLVHGLDYHAEELENGDEEALKEIKELIKKVWHLYSERYSELFPDKP